MYHNEGLQAIFEAFCDCEHKDSSLMPYLGVCVCVFMYMCIYARTHTYVKCHGQLTVLN